jgi:hypothetical protein
VLEQKKPDAEPGLDPRPALVAIERRNLAIDKVPVDLAGELHQLVPQIDDLVEPGAEQRNRSPSLVFFGFFGRIVPLRCADRITTPDSTESRKRNCKLPGLQTPKACNRKYRPLSKNRLPIFVLSVLHGRLTTRSLERLRVLRRSGLQHRADDGSLGDIVPSTMSACREICFVAFARTFRSLAAPALG